MYSMFSTCTVINEIKGCLQLPTNMSTFMLLWKTISSWMMEDMNNSDKQLYEWYIGLNFSAESFWQGWNIFRAFKLFPNHSRARYNAERFVCRVLSAQYFASLKEAPRRRITVTSSLKGLDHQKNVFRVPNIKIQNIMYMRKRFWNV